MNHNWVQMVEWDYDYKELMGKSYSCKCFAYMCFLKLYSHRCCLSLKPRMNLSLLLVSDTIYTIHLLQRDFKQMTFFVVI